MKKIQKLAALLLALLMMFSLATVASAENDETETETTYELFIKNDASGHTYDAYQIFAGDLSEDGTTLSNVEWGSSIADPAALVAALTTDTKTIKLANDATTTLKDVFVTLTTDTNKNLPVAKKAALVANILGTISNDSAVLDRFAELVGEVVYTSEGIFNNHVYLGAAVSSGNVQSTKEGVSGYAITGLPAGYYLIKDRDNTVTGKEGDFYSKYMISVVKSSTISVKGQGVQVEKTVNDTLDGTFTDYEDGHTNETLYFKWEGTLPNNLQSYDTYNYKFIDTMSKGLTYVRIETIYIENANGTVAHTIYDASKDAGLPAGVILTDPIVPAENGTTTFELEIVDLLKTYPSLIASQKVIVKYSSYMNRNAVINKSNPNEVKIEYDNNPNGEGTGTSVSDEAYTFTFEVNIDKFDSADESIKLANVEFILYYRDTVGDETTYHYAQVITEEMVEAGTVINGKAVTTADVGVVYGFTEKRDEASVLDTDANGAISLRGLNSGIFYLEETKTNDGYNLLDTPVQIDILPTYTEAADAKDYTVAVRYEVDGMDQGASSTVGVRNSKGSTLPSTGGIGTTIFYIVGAILVVGAGVILITKKRMANEK